MVVDPDVYDWEEIIEEGKAKLIIPKRTLFLRENGVYEPAWSPVFYNPDAIISRDFTSLVTKVYFNDKSFFFVDLLSGTGVRGVRLALETKGYGLINDVDPIAHYYCRRNIGLNNLQDVLEAYMDEANSLMNKFTFSGLAINYVDVDPYGSPVPYLNSIFKPLSKEALIGVTATDTAPLTCSHVKKTLYRYNIRCFKTDFNKELGLRILIFTVAQKGASLGYVVKPLLSFTHRHYFRVFFNVKRSGLEAYSMFNQCRGYLWYCRSTLERGFIGDVSEADDLKCMDGSKPTITGPTWICNLGDVSFVKEIVDSRKENHVSRETWRIASMLVNELGVNNPYLRYDLFFSLCRRNMVQISRFIDMLKEHGFKAFRTHMDPRGVKTDADVSTIYSIFCKD